MKVSFWSSSRGDCSVTSNLACISVMFTILYSLKILIIENHLQNNKVESFIRSRSNHNFIFENIYYHDRHTGVNSILYDLSLRHYPDSSNKFTAKELVKRLENVSEEIIQNHLFYIPNDARVNETSFELSINRHILSILKASEKFVDLTFVDTAKENISTKLVLQEADLIVVNLLQDPKELHSFFKNHSSILSKSLLLISNYDKNSYFNLDKIIQTYSIEKSIIATVPYNDDYKEALKYGRLISFLFDNSYCKTTDPNYQFMAGIVDATKKIYKMINPNLKNTNKENTNKEILCEKA